MDVLTLTQHTIHLNGPFPNTESPSESHSHKPDPSSTKKKKKEKNLRNATTIPEKPPIYNKPPPSPNRSPLTPITSSPQTLTPQTPPSTHQIHQTRPAPRLQKTKPFTSSATTPSIPKGKTRHLPTPLLSITYYITPQHSAVSIIELNLQSILIPSPNPNPNPTISPI